jgi:membrane-associated protease RseP (regulator of RpoE activity)
MLKQIGVVIVLLAAGVGLAMYLRGDDPAPVEVVRFEPQTNASAEVRIADLERALAAQIDRSRTLEARIAELERQRGEAGATVARGGGPASIPPERAAEFQRFREEGRVDPATMRERQRERRLDSLVEAGFTRERAEWIERRSEELEYQAMQAQFDAQRSGQPGQGAFDVQRTLRTELGDADYERYLRGTGRPTEVQVFDVLASSAAERAGIKPGDQIVSYAGTRVFDMRELNALSREGNPGETVIVEVRRNGRIEQVAVPRGVLGMSGGGMRGGQGGPGGRGGPPRGGPAR